MTRLTELDGAVRASPRPARMQQAEMESLILAARYARAAFVARMAGRLAAALARGFGAVNRALLSPVRGYLRERRTVAELERLNDHMLADIGLQRGQIHAAAAEVCRDGAAAGPSLGRRLSVWLTLSLERGATIRDLRALPDAVLRDIGVERASIPDVADKLMKRKAALAARGEYQVVTVVEQFAAQVETARRSFLAWMRRPGGLRQIRAGTERPAANRNERVQSPALGRPAA